MNQRTKAGTSTPSVAPPAYEGLVTGIAQLLDSARHIFARAVNSVMTATYWEIGHRIVEFEQGGKSRAEYGKKCSTPSGISPDQKGQTASGFSVAKAIRKTLSRNLL
ncbi:MAG: DUF1016 N-terminal domain-containing protein [bacterium]